MPLLEVKNLSKSYANVDALIKMDISVNVGEIVALIGKNGAGKTTLLNCIAGTSSKGWTSYIRRNLLQKASKLK